MAGLDACNRREPVLQNVCGPARNRSRKPIESCLPDASEERRIGANSSELAGGSWLWFWPYWWAFGARRLQIVCRWATGRLQSAAGAVAGWVAVGGLELGEDLSDDAERSEETGGPAAGERRVRSLTVWSGIEVPEEPRSQLSMSGLAVAQRALAPLSVATGMGRLLTHGRISRSERRHHAAALLPSRAGTERRRSG